MTVLLYVLGTYVAVCWLWGMYLAIRLYTGRRLTRLMQGHSAKSALIRPTATGNPHPTEAAIRAAKVIAKSKAKAA
jgi:hypothetical protein